MNKLKMNLKSREGITLISLVVTIIILIILASISISMILGNNGLLNKTQTASDETKKSQATETMNLKITNIQISSYTETQQLPNLQYLADKLCEDNDMEYVLTASKEHASLDKIDVTNISSIFTKLKEYPYEFEINSSLQLASIDGVKIATVPSNDDDSIVSMTKAELQNLIDTSINSKLNNYSTSEQIVGTWIDGKPIYRKVATKSETLTNLNIDYTLRTTIIYCDAINHPQIKYTCETSYQNGGFGVIRYVNDYKSGFTYNEYGGANIDYIIFEYTKTTD